MMLKGFFDRAASAAARLILCSAVGFLVLALGPAATGIASARADETVYACGTQVEPALIYKETETPGILVFNICGAVGQSNLQLSNDSENTVAPGKFSSLVATAPPGFAIAEASVQGLQLVGTIGTGYLAYFIWGSGQQRVDDTWLLFDVKPNPPASAFGFMLECNPSGSTCPATGASFGMNQIVLTVQETGQPAIVASGASNLWNQGSRWLRGQWPLSFTASDLSGILSMSASENGQPLDSPPTPGCWPDGDAPIQTSWQQCANPQTWSPTVSLSGSGHQQLVLSATSAARNVSSPAETINVDNTQPTVSLSGPTQASSTAGTQYVTATATVGPSGLGSISCSTDDGPAQSYLHSPASIPVSGIGMHSLRCTASNRSYNSAGQVAVSAPATWSLDIGQPTVSGISFAKIVNGLRCKSVRERVKVAAKWITVRRHGKLVEVHRRAHSKMVKTVKCHPRIVKRKVTVLVKEKMRGKTVRVKRTKVERVVVPPRVVSTPTKHVAFGKGTTVSGWLGTSSGTALGGRVVYVMTAPNNGLGHWAQPAAVTTAPDGSWSMQLGAGPSRVVYATYNGDTATEPSTSSTIHLIVPAKVTLQIRPRRVRWGGTLRISGRVLGGYLPSGKLLRLRIGVEGVRETVGIPSIGRKGRFHTSWTFAPGHGVVRYWFSVSTLNEADYPFAPASSRHVYVTVGPK
jgi:hypothetical protein